MPKKIAPLSNKSKISAFLLLRLSLRNQALANDLIYKYYTLYTEMRKDQV